MELGYHVMLVKDATVAFSKEMMKAAHEFNGPTFAHQILTRAESVAARVSCPYRKSAVKRETLNIFGSPVWRHLELFSPPYRRVC